MTARPTILHVNRVGFLGGVERVILTLAGGLEQHGFQVRLVCPEGELARAAERRGISVAPFQFARMRASRNPLVLGSYLASWLRGARKVRSLCEAQNVRLIHAHHPVSVLYAALAKKRLGVPLVLHVHEVLPAHRLYRLALRYAARYVDRYVCVSQAGRALIEATLDIDPGRVSVIHNGVDRSFLDAPRRAVSEALAGGGPHVGVFGVIEPRKGQDVFLEAARRLAVEHPNAQFWIVGPLALRDKARFAAGLRSAANRPPLAERVHFVGFQTNVRDWMQTMDVVVLPSVAHESLSMALLEALTLGRPTVGTSVGGGPEVIHDRITGRIVPPGDAAALAQAIAHLLTPQGRALGARAAEDARRRFGGERFCARMSEIYGAMLHAGIDGNA